MFLWDGETITKTDIELRPNIVTDILAAPTFYSLLYRTYCIMIAFRQIGHHFIYHTFPIDEVTKGARSRKQSTLFWMGTCISCLE